MTFAAAGTFGAGDWAVLTGYVAVVLAIGLWAGRRQGRDADEFFLAGRGMPWWAVAISLLATSQSAATFVGGPQQAYATDLTYLTANVGLLIGTLVVAFVFVPAFYRRQVTSVYELLGAELGTPAQRAASAMFLVGRVFASGARLFIVALPFSLIAFGDIEPRSMVLSIIALATAATAYTLVGGIRAVIWTDVLQAVVYIGTVCIALVLLWNKIGLGPVELVDRLRESGEGDKLRLFDWGLDFTRPYSIWGIVIGLTLFNIAAFGTDQDLCQRLLTCRDARSGSWSIIAGNLLGLPVVALFLLIGLLLFVCYQRPDIAGIEPPPYPVDDTRRVFLTFILHEMPAGLRGLMLAGLFAAAMSSLDSALNAMSASTIADFFPRHRGSLSRSRIAVACWGVCLTVFACVSVWWQRASGETLINFALGVMVYAYSGLLAVFLTVLLTRRGSAGSAVLALVMGFTTVWAIGRYAPALAFPWKMLLATALSFVVCCAAPRPNPA